MAIAHPRKIVPTAAHWASLLGRERERGVGMLVRRPHVAAKLIDEGHPPPGIGQTAGMRQRVRQRQGLVDLGQRLRWIPQQPEGQCGMRAAGHPWILAQAERGRPALRGG